MAEYDEELDATGLNCPVPILKAKKVLEDLVVGQVLRIVVTDPGAVKEFEAFARQTGNQLRVCDEQAGKFCFLIKKVSA